MALKIKREQGVVILHIRGKLMGGPETIEIRDTVTKLVQEGEKRLIIEMSKIKWMNSSGVGVMMACYSAMSDVNGKLGIVGLGGKSREAMSHSRIIQLFDEYESVKEAVQALF